MVESLLPAGAVLMCTDSGPTSMLVVGQCYVVDRAVWCRRKDDQIVWLDFGVVTFGSRFVRVERG